MAQQHLRNILAYLNVPTLAQPEAFMWIKEGFFDTSGNIADASTRTFMQAWMERYTKWVIQHAA